MTTETPAPSPVQTTLSVNGKTRQANAGKQHPVVKAQNGAQTSRPAVVQRILDKQMAEARNTVVRNAEDLDTEGRLPAFMGNLAMFRDTVFAALPDVAQTLVRFMQARPYTYTPERVDVHGNVSYGAAQQLLPDDVALTPEQVRIMHLLLTKATPGQMDVDTVGKPKSPIADNQVHITINQVGHTPNYHDLPGQVVGIGGRAAHPGASIQMAEVVFSSPQDTTATNNQTPNTMTITVPSQPPEDTMSPGTLDLTPNKDPNP